MYIYIYVILPGRCGFHRASLPREPVGDGRVLLEDGAGLPGAQKEATVDSWFIHIQCIWVF